MTNDNSTESASVARLGDNINNMSPPNHQGNQLSSPFWCGCDWLKLNFQVKFLAFQKTHELLDRFAMIAIERKKAVETVDLGGALMLPGGGSIGKGTGKKGKFCKYRLKMPFGMVVIAEGEKYAGTWPNLQINISGEICLTYRGGADEAYADAIKWLESLSLQIDSEKVSRVDFCADFPGWGMQRFVGDFQKRRWKCRARRKAIDQSGGTTLYFGTAPLMLRIYDKLAEMEASALRGEPVKFEHMIQKRWSGVRPDQAVRVEYQVSREKLKLWGIDSYADLKSKGGSVLGYLTGARDEPMYDQNSKKMMVKRWFRFLKKPRDINHADRDEVSRKWAIVQKTFIERFGKPEPLIEIEPDNADVEALIKQAFGVLEAAAWNKGYAIPDRQITNETKFAFQNYENFESWIKSMLRSVAVNKPGWCLQYEEYNHTAIGIELREFGRREQIEKLKEEVRMAEQEIKYLTEGEN